MRILVVFFWVLCPLLLSGQLNQQVVIAEDGDGIFSILRKQGLNPVKYYAEFVELNKDNLRNGSELHLGRAYIIPYAEDSYKKKAIEVEASQNKEEAIFESELANISPKSSKLKNAVIYLISGNSPSKTSSSLNRISQEITINLAQELMVHGAQVYIVKSKAEDNSIVLDDARDNSTEGAMADLSQMDEYVGIINKKYLKHRGKYQRLLITRVNDDIANKNYKVAVYHHNSSKDGKRVASNIQRVFSQNSVKSASFKEYTEVFTDKNNLYLAKNALPPITLIDIGNNKKQPSIDDFILVNSNQESLSNLIASGVLNDYADLEIEK